MRILSWAASLRAPSKIPPSLGSLSLLTRAGAFQLSPEGLLVTPDGALVLDDGAAPIFVPPASASLEVARDGTISVDGEPIARIGVVTAPAATLSRVGATAFRAATGVTPVEKPHLLQGAPLPFPGAV